MIHDPAENWKKILLNCGYQHHNCETLFDYLYLKRLTMTWRQILKITRLKPPASCFEVGCGGGIQIVRLALKGFLCTGIDVSQQVLERAKQFICSVNHFTKTELPIQLIEGDFMKIDIKKFEGKYDLVFNVGVIEHYLNIEDRINFLHKKSILAKPGGFIVSVVPSGIHPFRQEKKFLGWGGYNVPEIDYSSEMLYEEMRAISLTDIVVIPNNLFGYFLGRSKCWSDKIAYIFLQLFAIFLPNPLREKYAYSFIAIGRKSL